VVAAVAAGLVAAAAQVDIEHLLLFPFQEMLL
jgi:hypothetical protein